MHLSFTQLFYLFCLLIYCLYSPTTNTKEALALSLVQTFTCLNDGSDSGHVSLFFLAHTEMDADLKHAFSKDVK